MNARDSFSIKLYQLWVMSLLVMVVDFSLPSAAVSAHPWSMFQGDNRHTGRSSYPGPLQKDVAFSFPLEGITEGAPVVASDGTIYVGSHTGKLSAFFPSGQLKWEFYTLGMIRGTALIGPGNTIYIASKDGGLYAIADNGTLKWVYLTPDIITSSPVMTNDQTTILIATKRKGLFAIGTNGRLRWNLPLDATVTASAPAIGIDDTIYIGGYYNQSQGKFFAIGKDGNLLWSQVTPTAVRTSPAISDDGRIYFGTRGGQFYSFNPDGSTNWTVQFDDEIRASAAIDNDGTLYVGCYDKNLYALNPDGTIKWKFLTNGSIESSPVVDSAGTIYVASWSGSLFWLGRDGSLLNKRTLGVYYSSMAVGANDTLYIAGDFDLYGIGASQPPVAYIPEDPYMRVFTEKNDYYLGDTLTVRYELVNPSQVNKAVEVKIYIRSSSQKTTSLVNEPIVDMAPQQHIEQVVYTHTFDVSSTNALYYIGARVLDPETGDYRSIDFKTIEYHQ